MFKNKFIVLILAMYLLVACAPSQQSIQTAVAKTQAVYTPTPTLMPTPTINTCTDRGWADIEIYFKLFDTQMGTLAVGMSKQVYLDSLKSYQTKINSVDIDACSEHVRQTLIAGMGNLIYGMQLAITGGNQDDYSSAVTQGVMMMRDANTELDSLGIQITLSLK